MEKNFCPWYLYKGVTEDSMIHVSEFVMTYYQLENLKATFKALSVIRKKKEKKDY